jgi:hypothetical protein
MTYADDDISNPVPERPNQTPSEAGRAERPRVTLLGNSYDLTALAALATGLLVVLMCLTAGQAAYCLPFIAIVLGVIGLVFSKDAINPERTRLWSWLGLGGAGVSLLVGLLLLLSYFACIFFVMLFSWRSY